MLKYLARTSRSRKSFGLSLTGMCECEWCLLLPLMADLRSRLESVAAHLLNEGYAVLDGIPLSSLHAEMVALHAGGGLRQHLFGFKKDVAAKPQLFSKPDIFEAEGSDEAVQRLAPRLFAELDQLHLHEAAVCAFPSLGLARDAKKGVTVKLQCNEGNGGCFPAHYDNAGPPSQRRLTALFYLNPGWEPGDGGELELLPWLGAPLRLPPLDGRLVIFLSEAMLHRVLPCHRRRFCFTIWIDGETPAHAADAARAAA